MRHFSQKNPNDSLSPGPSPGPSGRTVILWTIIYSSLVRDILFSTLLRIEKRVFINWRMFWIIWFWQRYFHFIQFGCIAVGDWCWRRNVLVRCWWRSVPPASKRCQDRNSVSNIQKSWTTLKSSHPMSPIWLLQWCWWLFFGFWRHHILIWMLSKSADWMNSFL